MNSIMAFVAADLYIIVVVLTLIYLLARYYRRWLPLGVATLYLAVVGYGLSRIATRLISDPRPFIQTGQLPLIASATDNGFPSDHTLLLATLAAIVFLVDRRAALLVLLMAIVVGWARVYAGVHHTRDIVGSLVIAAIVLVSYFGVGWLWRRGPWSRLPLFFEFGGWAGRAQPPLTEDQAARQTTSNRER